MRILVYGAGRIGTRVICELRKNPDIEIVTIDPRGADAEAVLEKVIDKVDFEDTLTPVSLPEILAKARPDLILLATASKDLGLGNAPGMDMLGAALEDEVTAISEVPVISVARRSGARRRSAS